MTATSRVVALAREWTRIGRSLAADVRFDDPTVSRRHALIVRQADGVRVLDDRSLNGVFVNGERVEWRTLEDGDEIVVGRYHLHVVEVAGTPSRAATVTTVDPLGGARGRGLIAAAAAGRARDRDRLPPMALNDRGPLPEGRDRQDDGRAAR